MKLPVVFTARPSSSRCDERVPLYSACRSTAATATAATVAAGQEANDDATEGEDAADDGLEDAANA